MLKFCVILKDLLAKEEGQDLVEYVLIASLLALACISGVGGFGALVASLCDTIGKAAAQIIG
jgi:Flp pilus assembly pilin Flp